MAKLELSSFVFHIEKNTIRLGYKRTEHLDRAYVQFEYNSC